MKEFPAEIGIKDKNGVKVQLGDTLCFPYVDPGGTIHKDQMHFEANITFLHGCFGYLTIHKEFFPLVDWAKKKQGLYIPNHGNKILITDEYVFWIKEETKH